MRTGLVAGNGGGPPLGVVAALPLLLFVVALLIFVFLVSETLLHFVLYTLADAFSPSWGISFGWILGN